MILVDVWLLLQLVKKLVWNPSHRSCLQVFLHKKPNLQFTTRLNIMIRDPNKFMLELISWCSQTWSLKPEGLSKSQKRKPRGQRSQPKRFTSKHAPAFKNLQALQKPLYQSYSSKAFEIGKLQQDVQSTRDQLQVQINRNQTLDFQITRFESQMSNVQNLFGHKDAEINRLMSEVSRLRSSEARLEERLAALSAAPSVAAPNVEAQIRSSLVHSVPGNLVGTVDGQVVESPNDHVANGLQSSMEQRLDSMMAAIQILSDRMIDYEQNGADSNIPFTQATAALHSRQVSSTQLVLLIRLLMTVTGQRMRGVIVVIWLLRKRQKGIQLTIVPSKVQSQSRCPTTQPISGFGRML